MKLRTNEPPAALRVLGNATRWQILCHLRQGPKCVNALTCRLKVSQPAVSQHLKLLEHAGLVRKERVGLQIHYGLVAERLDDCLQAIQSLFPIDAKERQDMTANKQEEKCCRGKRPGECTPEQVRECHPEGGHPCDQEAASESASTGKNAS